jgi:hypothetical protein
MGTRRSISAGASISRRRLLQAGTAISSAIARTGSRRSRSGNGSGSYTRLGIAFINCTATLTINGGSLMLPKSLARWNRPRIFTSIWTN